MSNHRLLGISWALLIVSSAAIGASKLDTLDGDNSQQRRWSLATISESAFSQLPLRLDDDAKPGAIARCFIYGRDVKRIRFIQSRRTNDARCLLLGSEQDQSFAKAVAKIAKRLKPVGATIQGEDVFTEIYFTVALVEENGQPTVKVFPNWSHDVESYGDQYHAPQRVLDRGGVFRVADSCEPDGVVVQSAVDVDIDGKAHGPVRLVYHGERLSDRCDALLREHILQSRFIPAHQDGKPIQAYHVELWR